MSESEETLELLLAAATRQRRAAGALYRLARRLAATRARPVRRLRRAEGEVVHDVRGYLAGPPRRRGEPSLAATVETSIPSPLATLPLLEVRCFGRFEVLRSGVPVEKWRRAKAKALLKYLVVRHQPVPRDVLLEVLWPDAEPRFAANGLRVTLHALRQALGTCPADGGASLDYVVFDAGNYVLNPLARLWIDADAFQARFEAGRRAERQNQTDEAVQEYEAAEAIYRDDYLLEDLYEDWALVRREELKDQYLMIVAKLADYAAARGDPEGCIIRCHKILEKDPCREDAYRRLMSCYHQLGRRSQALHWYDLCVRTLRQELDVAPAEETRLLQQQIASGQNCGPASP